MSEPLANSMIAPAPPTGAHGSARPFAHAIPWTPTWILLLSLAALFSSLLVVALHMQRGFFVPILAVEVCALAALFDAWTTRIPNTLTYGAILLGVILNLLGTGFLHMHAGTAVLWLAAPGAGQSFLGLGVCAALGLAAMLIARVGGGDIKLLAAMGALLGLTDVGYVMIVALSVAVAYSLINLALLGRLNMVGRVIAMRTMELIYLRQFAMPFADAPGVEDDEHRIRNTIPMAVPLAIGLVIAQVWNIRQMLGGGGGVAG